MKIQVNTPVVELDGDEMTRVKSFNLFIRLFGNKSNSISYFHFWI